MYSPDVPPPKNKVKKWIISLALVMMLFFALFALTIGDLNAAKIIIVLAGAIGNLGDRLINGEVTDFVLVSFFPFVFNVADAAITVGGFLLAARLLFTDAALEPVPVAERD